MNLSDADVDGVRDVFVRDRALDRLVGLAGRDRAVGGARNDVCKVEAKATCR